MLWGDVHQAAPARRGHCLRSVVMDPDRKRQHTQPAGCPVRATEAVEKHGNMNCFYTKLIRIFLRKHKWDLQK